MNLHRTDNVPQWEKLDPSERNGWQRVAAATKGVVTPANAVTAAGYAVFEWGLRDVRRGNVGAGVAKVVAGRLFDIADGMVAEKTGTKSPLGEAFDATVDKIEAARGLYTFARRGIVPRYVAVSFAAQNAVNTLATFYAKSRDAEIHPSAAGKITTALQWGTVASYGLEATLPEVPETLVRTSQALAVSATVLGAHTSGQYINQALAPSGVELYY